MATLFPPHFQNEQGIIFLPWPELYVQTIFGGGIFWMGLQ
jgi:hypothetical protein